MSVNPYSDRFAVNISAEYNTKFSIGELGKYPHTVVTSNSQRNCKNSYDYVVPTVSLTLKCMA